MLPRLLARNVCSWCLVLLALLLAGCGTSHPLAPAGGVVTVDGKPFSGGRVVFAPVATAGKNKADVGPPAVGDIAADGRFVLSTFTQDDGAIVGQHFVTVYAEGSDEEEASQGNPAANVPKKPRGNWPKFDFIRLADRNYEVKAGEDNQFQIQLTTQELRQFAELKD